MNIEEASRRAPKEMHVSAHDLMTPNPLFVGPDATVGAVWDLMRERAIRHVPVLDGDTLVGMVSDRDLAHLDVVQLATVDGAGALRRALGTPIVKIMSSDVVSVGPEAGLCEIVDLLVERRIGAVPVVRPESGELIGIVSYVDVLAALRESLDNEE